MLTFARERVKAYQKNLPCTVELTHYVHSYLSVIQNYSQLSFSSQEIRDYFDWDVITAPPNTFIHVSAPCMAGQLVGVLLSVSQNSPKIESILATGLRGSLYPCADVLERKHAFKNPVAEADQKFENIHFLVWFQCKCAFFSLKEWRDTAAINNIPLSFVSSA